VLKSTVAKTMNKIKQNLVVSEKPQMPYYQNFDVKPTKGTSFRNTSGHQELYDSRGIYEDDDEDEEDYRFINR
jgi:hypothetical protein